MASRYKSHSMASTIKKKSAWSELSGKTDKKINFKQPKLNENIKIKYLPFIIIIKQKKKTKKNNLQLGTKIFNLDKKAYQKDNQIYYRSCN